MELKGLDLSRSLIKTKKLICDNLTLLKKKDLLNIPRKLIMLPGPTNVSDRVMNAMITPLVNHRSKEAATLFKDTKEKTQKVFETDGDVVVLTSSGTGGMEAAVKNLVRRGDNVIVPAFGEFGHRLADQISQSGANVKKVVAEPGLVPSIEEIEEAFEETKDVKALYVVYNETSTGTSVKWLQKAGEICSKYGSFFVVDAISNLGGDTLPVDKWGVDVCVTASQKCLAGPPGLALISMSERAKKYMIDNPPSTLYFNMARYIQYDEKGQTPFTPSLPLLYALNEALTVILEEGLFKRIMRHKTCADAFYSGFKEIGAQPFAEADARSNTVITINYPDGIDDSELRTLLEDKFRILIASGFGNLKGKLFRVGCMGDVSGYHVNATLTAMSAAFSMLRDKSVDWSAI